MDNWTMDKYIVMFKMFKKKVRVHFILQRYVGIYRPDTRTINNYTCSVNLFKWYLNKTLSSGW